MLTKADTVQASSAGQQHVNIAEQFRLAIEASGMTPPSEIVADGSLRRFSANGKRHDKAGWYVLHGDGLPAGAFGNWRDGFTQNWCSKTRDTMTEAERQAYRARMQAIAAQREAERAQRQEGAASAARQRWGKAEPASEHPYLSAKGVQPHGLREHDGLLLVALQDAQGQLHSVQTINAQGDKRFLSGGRVKGCFYPIGFGEDNLTVVVCEGFATGASIHEATGHAVAVAFNAGNLLDVTKALHDRHPDAQLVVAADDDHRTDGNPGITQATVAAASVGARLAVPVFGEDRGDRDTDFNDLHKLAGLDAVKACFAAAKPQSPFPTDAERPRYVVLDDWTMLEDRKWRPGVYYCYLRKQGRGDSAEQVPANEWFCAPLHVEAITFDEQSNNFGRLVRFRNSLGHWREWAMPMELLRGSGEELRGELLAMGLELDPRGGRQHLAAYLQAKTPKRRMHCALQVGWSGDSFVLPDVVIGPSAESVIFQSGERGNEEYTQAGTLDDWRQGIAARAPGNPLLLLALSAAFAGPMLAKCNAEGGGVHFVGDSSTGKTSLIEAACSVWGGPSYRRSWRATANGLEGAAALSNDSLLALDEISEADPRQVGEIVYMIGNGRGKQRASRSGSARSVSRWRCMVLSSGERTIATTMREGGHRVKAGQAVRLLNVPVARAHGVWDELHGMDGGQPFSDAIKHTAARHHGQAGRAFLERLSRDPRDWCAMLEEFKSLPLFDATSGEGQDKRAAARFALIGLAGEAATEYGVTGWTAGVAINAAAECYQLWLSTRGKGNNERRQIAEQLSDFIDRHGDGRFSDADHDGDERLPVRDRAGWWRDEGGERFYLFSSAGMREALTGFDFKQALDVLQEIGGLPPPGADGKRAILMRVGGRARRLYRLDPSKLAEVCHES